jgi:hypothetical protein
MVLLPRLPQIRWPHPAFTLTTFLAVWGAILSSVTFGWNLLRDLRDRANVKVSVAVRKIITRMDGVSVAVDPNLLGDDGSPLHVVISAVNVGRRPVRWQGVGGRYRRAVNGKKGFVINARFLPKTLAEAEAHDEYTDFDGPFKQDNVRLIKIWDSFGKDWSLSWWQMRKLRKEAKRYAQIAPPNEHPED